MVSNGPARGVLDGVVSRRITASQSVVVALGYKLPPRKSIGRQWSAQGTKCACSPLSITPSSLPQVTGAADEVLDGAMVAAESEKALSPVDTPWRVCVALVRQGRSKQDKSNLNAHHTHPCSRQP